MEPFFLPGSMGRLFCLYVAPTNADTIRHTVLHVPAFAEEMNKSRAMVTRQAHRFAEMGIATLIFDYFGTGDSEGEFHDAGLDTWVRDTITCIDWLETKGVGALSLWANRLGAGIALDALHQCDAPVDSLVLWQPVVNGGTFLKQFLRLRRAAEMFYSSTEDCAEPTDGPIEVAGYLLQPGMAESITAMHIREKPPACSRIAIFEVSNLPEPVLTRPARLVADAWRETGTQLTTEAVGGEPYWSTLEASVNNNVLDHTVSFFADGY